jgi:cobalamin biosynthesis Mg chelatase CobN
VVKVNGEVQDVLGPRLFTIDEREWMDLDGETLVMVPAPLAALVDEGSPVSVTGTLRNITLAEIQREWGWFDSTPGFNAEFEKRAVIVADAVTNTSNGAVLSVRMQEEPKAVGTSGSSTAKEDSASAKSGTSSTSTGAGPTVTDLKALAASSDRKMVGRRVQLQNATVASVAKDGGFWVSAGSERLFVLPSTSEVKVSQGQTVDVNGHVLVLPRNMKDRLGDGATAEGEEIYVYANQVNSGAASGGRHHD